MEKEIKTDLFEMVKKTKPFHATHGNKTKTFVDVEYWKKIELVLKNYQNQQNKFVFVRAEIVCENLKQKMDYSKIPSNFGYFTTKKLIENKIRVHIGYEKITEKNQKQISSLMGENLKLGEIVCKMSYITDTDINGNTKLYEQLRK